MSEIEIAGAVLGVINIILLIRRSIWNYPFGIAMVILYGIVFFQARLYSDATLQVFFLLIQFYGWWAWLRAQGPGGAVAVTHLTTNGRLWWAIGIVLATLADCWFLATRTNDAAPWPDAFTTVLSLAAQYLLSVRRPENWLLWIAVDIVSIGLYFWRGLYPTTALYVIFLAMASAGLLQWRRAERAFAA